MSGAVEIETGARNYKGIRRRRWGKWVSEIRVPGTQERLWLGSYSTPEGAAVAHDVAYYCLRRPSSLTKLNFPSMLPPHINASLSPKSIQKAASDAGMAVDAQMHMGAGDGGANPTRPPEMETEPYENDSCGSWEGSVGVDGEGLSVSVEDYL